MTLALVGSVGLGLVWGWLTARLEAGPPATARSYLALAVCWSILVVLVAVFAPWPAPAFFLSAAALALLLHLGWLQELRRRVRPST
jgi:hypothetical protein